MSQVHKDTRLKKRKKETCTKKETKKDGNKKMKMKRKVDTMVKHKLKNKAKKEADAKIEIKLASSKPKKSKKASDSRIGLDLNRDFELQWRVNEKSEQNKTENFSSFIGTDEVGRGCLAGPIVASACYIPIHVVLPGVRDSKKIKSKLEQVYKVIKQDARIIACTEFISHQEVDELNPLQASLLAMSRAVNKVVDKMRELSIDTSRTVVFVDGNQRPKHIRTEYVYSVEPVVKADQKIFVTAVSSIIAKVERDTHMREMAKLYPHYGLESNVGYGTPQHLKALEKYGACPIHRISYSPVKDVLKRKNQKETRTEKE